MNFVFSDFLKAAIRDSFSDATGSTFNLRYWLSTPGPIYCANTDNCGGGPIVAPNNVALDEGGYEIIFRQPSNDYELRQVIEAAECEPFEGYRFDGNSHWTPKLVDEWSSNRDALVKYVNKQLMATMNRSEHISYYLRASYDRWFEYIRHDLDTYLTEYKSGLISAQT